MDTKLSPLTLFDLLCAVKSPWLVSVDMFVTDHFEDNQQTKIVYQDRFGNSYIKKVAELAFNKELIGRFSPRDAYLLGYLLGNEKSR